jgi:ribonuclease PH
LCYTEDVSADADINVAMTGDGRFVEVQGTAEGNPFDRPTLDQLLDLAAGGIEQLLQYQHEALAKAGV